MFTINPGFMLSKNISLKDYNTFRLDYKSEFFYFSKLRGGDSKGNSKNRLTQ